ncbi:unnamed protein product, partial [marine sediment metagenome]
MKYQKLVKGYRDVEVATYGALRDEISKSDIESQFISGCNAIEV